MFHVEIGIDKWAEGVPQLRANLFPIEFDIVEMLFQIHKVGNGTNDESDDSWNPRGPGDWTRRVKEGLFRLGRTKGFLCYPQLADTTSGFSGEWMLDFAWIEASCEASVAEKDRWQYCTNLVMACESEWGTTKGEILADFLKLTFIHADIRLFIYSQYANEPMYEPLQWCKNACPDSRGFRYVLVGVPGEGDFCVDAWTR